MVIKKNTLVAILGALAAILLVGGALYAGFRLGQQDPKVITVKNITNVDDPEVKADFGLFWQVWDKLREQHIDGDKVSEKDLVYGAVAGLVEALGDPHTVFFPPEDAKKFEEDVSGSFGGIGAEIGVKDDQLVVISPLKDSPAENAGLLPKDKIIKINDEFTGDINVSDAVKKIRGEIGTTVVLTILRNGWEEPKDFSIIRDEIRVPTVDWEIKEGDVLHLQLYAFNENAPTAFYKAIVGASLKGANGIVLDLRNNPGGYLEVAVNIAGWFLPRGSLVAIEEFRSGERLEFKASGNEALKDIPMVILVNGGSASASEILAGALKDLRNIQLIGEKTFGKGTVQELQTLKDRSSLKITIARWLTPKGYAIEKDGLAPDYEVKLTPEDVKVDKDPQLDKAIEILKAQF